jgi:uncharacterized protein
MADTLLGKGWWFPLVPDATGALRYSSAETNVEQALKVVLLTKVGERVMRPTFGSRVSESVFAPGSERSLGLLEGAVRDAIRDWEPRVDLLGVSAAPDPEVPERVQVTIDYRIRRTNSRQNLVFPFYVGAP